jgi:hypothetical protein
VKRGPTTASGSASSPIPMGDEQRIRARVGGLWPPVRSCRQVATAPLSLDSRQLARVAARRGLRWQSLARDTVSRDQGPVTGSLPPTASVHSRHGPSHRTPHPIATRPLSRPTSRVGPDARVVSGNHRVLSPRDGWDGDPPPPGRLYDLPTDGPVRRRPWWIPADLRVWSRTK